ncbi:flagellar hook-length control protein FliK [Butyrivibrio sp. INlla16]|uniref:flagellar hook-length control protein FliK n=1 Tax=Butyrivibrio sp. INlla16 TaxID=1520807 RepID=UPI00088AC16D|nr:flagellar hook-length control protein FliK [Butyrivibrio sp. INlla16]SDB48769.1 hook-length control protein FliK [Butyrivibrio sp. INlla16]
MSIIQNLTGNRPVVQVDGHIVNQNAAKSQDSLRSLETGERLSGKIISMSDENGAKNAQIRLGDDTVINAKLQDGMYLKEGQTISFQVRGTSGQITLTPLYENTSVDPTALKALNAAGIEVTQDTVNMVKTMMENGMGIDKDSLNAMQQTVNSHPEAEVTSLVQMKALNIPITEQNIGQFESYKNYEHQVVETMKSIMDDLPEAYNQLVQNGEGEKANDLYGKILNMLSDGAEHMEQTVVKGNAATMIPEQNAAAGTNLATGEVIKNADAANGEQTILAEGENESTVTPQNNDAKVITANGENIINPGDDVASEAQKSGNVQNTQSTVSDDPNIKELQVNSEETQSGKVTEKAAGDQSASTQKMVFDNDFAKLIKELNTNTGATGDQIQKLIAQAGTGKSTEIDQMALIKELADAYQAASHSAENKEAAFSKIFSSNEYNKLMKNVMQEEWLIRPDDVSIKENVENLYTRLSTQAKQLTQQLTESLGPENKVAQSAMNLQNNIDFMNQINQMFHYIQLPLKMADQDAHGDLYVYSNGKKKFEPGDTVSAILHLDMDNLGPLDVYVKMKDTNVKTNFYVADESVIDLIAEHIGELNDRLNKRGYTMEARMMLHTDQDENSEDPPVSSLLDSKKTAFLSTTSFDARA